MSERIISCDVAVIGAGPGGVTAALAAAREGAKVVLAERNGHIGGNLVMGLPLLGYLDQNGNQIIGGMAQEFVDDLVRAGHCYGHSRCPMHNSITILHPEMLKLLLFQKCREAGVRLLLHSELTDAHVEGGKLTRVTMTGKGMHTTIEADVFIDATGDGDLGYLCGAAYEKGAVGTGVLQPPTVMFSLIGVEEEKFFAFLDAHPENMKQLDSVIVGPGYNTALWRSTPNHVFVGMQSYLEQLRREHNLPVLRENIIYINSTLPDKVFVNTVRVPGCDGSDIDSLTQGEIDGHLQIPGIVDMFKHYVPGFENCHLDGISSAIGIRESRRFAGIDTLRIDRVLSGAIPCDTIALGGYKVDIHNGEGKGTILKEVKKPYGIGMGCLISREIDGLLFSGRCISMDSESLGSQRIMPTCMAVGEAAGILAAKASQGSTSPRDVQAKDVQKELLSHGAILNLS